MLGRLSIQLGWLLLAIPAAAGTPDTLDKCLREGRIHEGLAAYASPSNSPERFSLAVLQALDGLQQFSAGMHNVGINPEFIQSGIPFFRVVMPGRLQNPKEPATPAKVARLFQDLRASLRRANATLARMGDEEFAVEVNLSQVRLDLDGDGTCSPNETLLASLGQALGLAAQAPGGREVLVHFDRADAAWLKGYTHFLSGMLDLVLLIQGSALVPYLEEGAVSDQRTWSQLIRAFEGGFFRFAIWSN